MFSKHNFLIDRNLIEKEHLNYNKYDLECYIRATQKLKYRNCQF